MIITNENVDGLALGTKVQLLDVNDVLDELIIKRIGEGGDPLTKEIELTGQELAKDATFAWMDDGWTLIFRDPFTGARVFSQNSPDYTIKKITK